ncbi:RICIN domain-containing protein [Dactylosporangium sp. CS-033363]|uniref:RICIN domain-containing protein n=1 Tax=Dactylosporangium sp. CS-033363 TaxID=3239935 RepID=UPI003D8F6484
MAASAAVALTAVGLVTLPAYAATGPTISSWVTTPDMSRKLSPGAPVTFGTGSTQSNNITVDPNTTYQTIDGFGASITDSSAVLLSRLPQSQRDAVMASIFSPTSGTGMSWLRQPLGASDFVDGPFYTYDDLPSGQTDPSLAHFSIAHDQAQIIPLVKQAINLNPSLKVVLAAWGQPAWMKDSGSLVGGHLLPQYYSTYAGYLLKSIQAYQAAGVPIWALSVQNEPQNRTPLGYPGTDLQEAAEIAVVNALGPMLQSNGLGNVKIMGFDHNWAEHPNDTASAQKLGEDPELNYAADIMRSSAAQYLAGTAYHCYYGDAGAQTTQHNAFPNKDVWMTECSGSHDAGQPLSQYFSDTLNWHVKNVLIPSLQNWAKGLAWWNLALDSSGNPHNQGCGTCTGTIAIDGTTITYNAEYYITGHASKFVKPGAVRVGSGNAGDVHTVTFRNPDGSYAMIAGNNGGGTQTFSITFNGNVATETLPPNALATYTWAGSGTTDTTPPSAPGNLTASGTTATSTNLSWAASTDNVGVTGYSVSRNGTQIATTASTSYTATGLSASTAYSFTVRAFDAAGNVSAASNTVNVTTSGTGGGGIDPARWYSVVNANSSKCLDAANGGTGNGTALQQWTCYAGNNNQQWQFQPTDGGYYKVVTRNATSLGWDVAGGAGATGNGAQIQLWTYSGGTNQQWKPVQNADGSYHFTPRNNPNNCLDVTNVSTSDGARLQQWSCTGGAAQQFTVQ